MTLMDAFRARKLWIVIAAVSLAAAGCGTDSPVDEAVEETAPTVEGSDMTEPGEESGGDVDSLADVGEPPPGSIVRVAAIVSGSTVPFFLAAEKYAEQFGIEVEIDFAPGGGEVLAAVSTGQADFGGLGVGAVLYNAVNEGLPVRLAAPMSLAWPEDYWVLSSDVAPTPEDAAELGQDLSAIADGTFAVNAPGVIMESILADMLERGGLDQGSIAVEYIPFPDQLPALGTGAIVGAMATEPFASIAESQGVGYRPFERPDTPPSPITVAVVNTDWADENPEVAVALMQAYAMAATDLAELGWFHDDALDALESFTDLDTDVISQSRPPELEADLAVDLDAYRRAQEFFVENGAVDYDQLIPEEDMWDFRWRDAALARND